MYSLRALQKRYWGRCVRKINPECYEGTKTNPEVQEEKCNKQQQIADACSDILNITKSVRDDIKKTHPDVPLIPTLHSSTESSSVGALDEVEVQELDDSYVRKISSGSSSW